MLSGTSTTNNQEAKNNRVRSFRDKIHEGMTSLFWEHADES